MSIDTAIIIQQGATLQKLVTVTNVTTGLPFDLTGYTPRGQVRDLKKNLIAEMECSVYGDNDHGQILLVIDASVTTLITCIKPMKYTVEIEDDNDPDIVYRVAEGDVTLSQDYCLPIPTS